jgi:hypothetical protein
MMFHTFDLFLNRPAYTAPVTPIYVMSDSDYKKRLDRQDQLHIQALESRKAEHEKMIKSIDAELERMKT